MAVAPEPQTLKYPKIRGFELQEVIGEGGFSKVFRAYDYSISMVAACKVVALNSSVTQSQRKDLHKEIKVHSQLRHKNILDFYGSLVIEDDGKSEYVPAVYMVLELASAGDLFDKIAPDYGVDEHLAHYFFNQLIDALCFIHGIGVCHRDLKPENVLLDAHGQLKLSDFGLCSVYRHKGSERHLTERCGSLPYIAPELCNSKKPYRGEPIDVWGAGVILFTLLVGNTPWDEPSSSSPEYVAYLSGKIFTMSPWDRITGNALALLLDMLTVDPAERITLEQIVAHPWCMRPSQIAREGPQAVAEALSSSLRRTGDLELAEPNLVDLSDHRRDEDQIMMTATNHTQFSKSLLLFSQTQNGPRVETSLTRFYTNADPRDLLRFITQVVERLGLKYRSKHDQNLMRVGGLDRRKEPFKGNIEIEYFKWEGPDHTVLEGSRCVMKRDKGNPTEWRRLWKDIVSAPEVDPYVLRKR
ncbi:hypothetical protein BS47DRAFT_1335310 [Hydnum rufescens UP504]|uniref:Protein kinase domain-containing protein n=1 Tax=Hydnum rufescens UP504 TaxID=1448309 RepID=A0A9P6BB94_9AGAM|nr:hypothetical protein BS47DRAFT_1335310 [Hydnum rufescens UP504]